jgi:hypothetical protein|tara:strand:- start:40182 stop:40289 length:108 start_codon:yes stop_codon:yes gene_type:complete
MDKYEKAYHLLMEYWDSFDKEQQKALNKELDILGV